ncbi:hypothetical protein [Tumebacillus flagellatus]|uniref:hypothetical protein n=1 Tax=Tumebacillus flagellatus TaxID=1157490 RepID=UPI001268339B|nr:hypothetical protein [Tumebacillus flagellatus]
MRFKISTLAVMGVLSLFVAQSASANAFVGGYDDCYPSATDSGVTSIFANIKTPSTYPVVGSNSGSSAWVMITGNDSHTIYAQVGWEKSYGISSKQNNAGDGVHYFYEINYGGSADNDIKVFNPVGPDQGVTHAYRLYNDGKGNFVGTEDGAQIGSYSAFKGTGVTFAEELNGTNQWAAAYPGSASSPAVFDSLRYFFNGTTYYSPGLFWVNNAYGGSDRTNYKYGVDGSSSYIKFWDTRY